MDIVDIQTATELNLSKRGIYLRLEQDLARDRDIQSAMEDALASLNRWMNRTGIYLDEPMEVIKEYVIAVLKLDERREVISALAGQMSYLFDDGDKVEAITLANRILVVLCDADLFDISSETYTDEDEETGAMVEETLWYVSNPWELTRPTKELIRKAMYLPPMVVQPMKLTHNSSSPHLTGGNSSLILGKFNHHEGDICLDALNIANSVALALNVEMLKGIKQSILVPKKLQLLLKQDPKRKEQYDKFMSDSANVYGYLVKNGNRFYLPHKPDKRGRIYAQGYHANTQGDIFRKSIVDLHNTEIVEGF